MQNVSLILGACVPLPADTPQRNGSVDTRRTRLTCARRADEDRPQLLGGCGLAGHRSLGLLLEGPDLLIELLDKALEIRKLVFTGHGFCASVGWSVWRETPERAAGEPEFNAAAVSHGLPNLSH